MRKAFPDSPFHVQKSRMAFIMKYLQQPEEIRDCQGWEMQTFGCICQAGPRDTNILIAKRTP